MTRVTFAVGLSQLSSGGAAFGSAVSLAAGQAENRGQTVTCRDHADLRVLAVARLANALRPFVFLCHAPSKCTLTLLLSRPKHGEQPLEHAFAEPDVDRGLVAEPLRQSVPLVAILRDVRKRADEDDVRTPHVPVLNRQIRVDSGAMSCRDLFHDYAPLDCHFIIDR